MKKKLHEKLRLKSETLRYLDRVWGGSAAPTCADTCDEPPTGGCTWDAFGPLACASDPAGTGCNSTFPLCQMSTVPC